MAVAITALVIATSGVTWAATSLPRNSVGSPQVDNNSLRGKDIRNNSLRGKDIRNRGVKNRDIGTGAVDTRVVRDDSLGGGDIFEGGLGQVPSALRADSASTATNANNADQLGGQAAGHYITRSEVRPFREKLAFGERREFVRTGPIALEAECRENVSGNQDELRMLAKTDVDGSFMQGDTPHSGPGVGSTDFDNTTDQNNRTMGGIVSTPAGDGLPAAEDDIDTGFVAGPNGEYIGIDETVAYMLHIGGSDCMIVGVATIIG